MQGHYLSSSITSMRFFLLVLITYAACCGMRVAAQAVAPETITAPDLPKVVFEAPSVFNRAVFVVDENGYRSLRFGDLDGEDQSRIRLGYPRVLPMPYLRSAAVGLAVPEKVERLLMIGLGGGAFPSFVQAHFPEVYIDAVDIDPVVAAVAVDYFDTREDEKLNVHVADAVEFIREDRQPYDLIFLDAYDADELPDALSTHRFFSDVSARLAPGGVVVANIAIKNDFKARLVARKLMRFYESCLHLRSTPSLNDVLLLTNASMPDKADLLAWTEQFGSGATWEGMTEHIREAQACM